jgi:hypothetical protein
VYAENLYVAAMGTGNDPAQAAKSAYAALTATFGQSIQVDETLNSSYREMVRSGGAASWTDSTSLESAIRTSTSLDALLGSEIRERYNERGTYYALAVMDRAKARQMYGDIVNANLAMIAKLTDIRPAEKNTLEGYAGYKFAATVADITASYKNVLTEVGGAVPAGIKDGSDFRTEVRNIIRAIPVSITVENDRNNRVRDAFAKAFADQGFNTGGSGSPRYRLNARLNLSRVENPPAGQEQTRYELTANFTDTSNSAVLIPFSISNREGHRNLSEAENRAVMAVEKRISEEYTKLLSGYLIQLRP